MSARSPGVMMIGAVGQLLQQVLDRHGADHDVERLALQELRVADHEATADGLHQGADRRCAEQPVVRHGPGGQVVAQRRAHREQALLGAAVGDDAEHLGVLRPQLGDGDLRHGAHLVRLAVRAAHDEQHRRAEVGRDARVERELGRPGDVGVVRADDDHDVAAPLDVVVPRDDARERRLGVGVDLVVGDPDAGVVVEVDAVVREQQLQDVVRRLRRPRDGSEDADPRDRCGSGGRPARGRSSTSRCRPRRT